MKLIRQIAKALFRFAWHIVVLILLLLLGFHFWFIHNSEKTIEELISFASGGKLKSEMKKFRINYFDNNIDIKDLKIFNTDSASEATSYYFSVQNFHLKIRSKWELLFHKKLIVDSILFNAPDISVIRKSSQQHDTSSPQSKFLLAEELGNVYKTINQSLSVLHLQRLEINEGHVLITDANKTDRVPFRLSHIFLSVDKLNIDSADAANPSRFVLPERILLKVHDQNILLPDNKSTVSFKELMLDSREKLIQITNPSVNILPLAEKQSNFISSAEKLTISGLDFNALYQHQLVKADSVFVEKADGRVEIYANHKHKEPASVKRSQLDSTIYHLPVAVDIRHIVMQQGSAIIYLHQNEKTTTFQTKNDNVSVEGVHVNDSLGNLLSIDGFYYTVRNYVGYTPDSIYRFRFDSLQFINNKIVLHHFTTATVKQAKATLIRDYTVPRLEIMGFDWIYFIFENHFRARNAILYNPVLHIEKNMLFAQNDSVHTGKKKSIYQTLSVMDSIVDLDQLHIVHGNFSFRQGSSINMQLQNLNMDLNADALTKAKSVNQLVSSVNELSFYTANANNASASLFIGNSAFNKTAKNLALNNVSLRTADRNILVDLHGVALTDFSFDNNELDVNGVNWNEGTVRFDMDNKTKNELKNDNHAPEFFLNNITGNNTKIIFKNEKFNAGLVLKTISANSLNKQMAKPFITEGFFAEGNTIDANFENGKLQCSGFVIHDNQLSQLKNILFEKKTVSDTILIHASSVSFIPSLNETIATGNLSLDSLSVQKPEMRFVSNKNNREQRKTKEDISLPHLNITNFSLDNASVFFNKKDNRDKVFAESENISLHIKTIATQKDSSLLVNQLSFLTENPFFKKNDSITISVKDRVAVDINSFSLQPSTQSWSENGATLISGAIEYSVNRFSKSRSTFLISNVDARHISASSSDFKNTFSWLLNSSKTNLQIDSVRLHNEHADLKIDDFHFDQAKTHAELKSFSIDPGKNKEEFIKSLTTRKDFMQASSGKISMDGIQMKDSIIEIPLMKIDNGYLSVYSDKFIQAGPETIQPLPTPAIKIIPATVEVNKITLNNMSVKYAELNADTKKTGQVSFTKINGSVSGIASRDNGFTDSLQINVHAKFLDTLPLHLTLNESYRDSLSGLSLRLQLGPGDLNLLNPFLVPLVSMRAKSGALDTMSLSAIANDKAAHGSMRLYFENLKADILDSGNTQHKKFGTKLLNFFANTFAIRKRNKTKTAEFSFMRLRYKSSISYFLKMVVEGAARSVAPMSSILLRKKNKQELKQVKTIKPNN
ncbi:MAG: hypothetical protein JST87_09720 [Bacteroidetes bacterium]|nr:hypothetical protein [Bacteroidota bacterium]